MRRVFYVVFGSVSFITPIGQSVGEDRLRSVRLNECVIFAMPLSETAYWADTCRSFHVEEKGAETNGV